MLIGVYIVRDVHKVPALDLVGWFTLTPPNGPLPEQLAIHQQLLEHHNESALLLGFHPISVTDGSSKGGKLPFTIYETSYESTADNDEEKMQAAKNTEPQLGIRFKEVPYAIETGEAEMISVDFVARGGSSATVAKESQKQSADTNGKGKSKAHDEVQDDTIPDADLLSAEDEEVVSSLIAKANAVRMLQERVALTKAYLSSIPPCYLNTPVPDTSSPVQMSPDPRISQPILRSISSMLARLPLLSPPTSTPNASAGTTRTAPISLFTHEAAQQQSDVALITLLGSLGSTLRSAQDLGQKAAVVEKGKSASASKKDESSMGRGFQPSGMNKSFKPAGSDEYGTMEDDSEFVDDGFMEEEGEGDDGGDGGFEAGEGGVRLGDGGGGLAGMLPASGRAFLDRRLGMKRGMGGPGTVDDEMQEGD